MGIVTRGIPKEIVTELAAMAGATVFVETGTLYGATTRWASNYFETVHTIEREENLFRLHCDELSRIKGVTPHLGDSRDKLPAIVKELNSRKAVYWLDGHWSGGTTAGEKDECPVMEELAAVAGRNDDIILIDDARLFLGAPPLPHDPAQWPGIADIITAAQAGNRKPFMQIVNDVIFIVPDREDLRGYLVNYAQQHANDIWHIFGKKKGHLSTFWKNLKTRIRP